MGIASPESYPSSTPERLTGEQPSRNADYGSDFVELEKSKD
jgi:hypothetical protein